MSMLADKELDALSAWALTRHYDHGDHRYIAVMMLVAEVRQRRAGLEPRIPIAIPSGVVDA